MRYLLILLSCACVSPLMAEMIGNVEYQLPKLKQEWKIHNQLDGKGKSTTIVYHPDGSAEESRVEFFGAHINNKAVGGMDRASLEKAIQPLVPDQKVAITILESDATSVLFEWSSEEPRPVRGLTRGFTTPEGSAMLMYLTEVVDHFEKNRPAVLEALKAAQLK